jgi:hypothetical protein
VLGQSTIRACLATPSKLPISHYMFWAVGNLELPSLVARNKIASLNNIRTSSTLTPTTDANNVTAEAGQKNKRCVIYLFPSPYHWQVGFISPILQWITWADANPSWQALQRKVRNLEMTLHHFQTNFHCLILILGQTFLVNI